MNLKTQADKNFSEPCLIYIAGYGRSGSTLLERILNSHPQIKGLGELSFLFTRPDLLVDFGRKCACGTVLKQCTFWGPILQKLSTIIGDNIEDFVRLQRQVQGIGLFEGLGLNDEASADRKKRYGEIVRQIYQTIWGEVPPETKVLIDSSKTAYSTVRTPVALYKLCGINLRVIHLVRDVRGVMWSMINKGLVPGRRDPKKLGLAGTRALTGWIFANRAADSLARLLPEDRYLRIRYEDLMARPKDVLKNIGEFISLDLYDVHNHLLQGTLRSVSHQILGNPMRFTETIQLAPDVAWNTKLSMWHRFMARMMASHQMRKYGYYNTHQQIL